MRTVLRTVRTLPNHTIPNLTVPIKDPIGSRGLAPTTDGDDDATKGPRLTPRQVFDLYNTVCVRLPKVRDLTNSRAGKLRTRIGEHPDIDWWRDVFTKINSIPFYYGDGPSGWKASLDWLIKNDTNAQKVLEREDAPSSPSRFEGLVK